MEINCVLRILPDQLVVMVGDDEKQQRSDQLGDEGRYIASVGTLYERIIETVS
jgi:hypothetical protein